VNNIGLPEPYIHMYIRFMYGVFSREITIHTVINGEHTQFWPTLQTTNPPPFYVVNILKMA